MFELIIAAGLLAIVAAAYKVYSEREQPEEAVAGGAMLYSAQRELPAQGRRNWLVGVDGQIKDKAFHIGTRMGTLGRAVTNAIQLNDVSASRVHCQVVPTENGLRVVDMNSATGTFINNKRLRGTQILRNGDVLKIGHTSFRYLAQGDFKDSMLTELRVSSQQASDVTGLNQVSDVLRAALDASMGDMELAALNLGMTQQKFTILCKRYGI